jgi:hypothetical protein
MPYKVLVHGQRYLLALRNSRKNLSTKLFPEHFLPIQKKPAHRVSSIPASRGATTGPRLHRYASTGKAP